MVNTLTWPGRARIIAAALLLCAPAAQSLAQGLDCGRLQAEIARLSSAGSGRGAQYGQAAYKQQGEIDRTASYARSIGCERTQFFIFGSAPPPQCGAINAQIGRMRANLGQLRGAADEASGGARRRDLTARYDAYCRGQQTASRGLFDGLFGGNNGNLRQVPLEDAFNAPERDAAPRTPRGGSHAICVRSCDGGFFPLSYSAGRADLDDLQELCQAQCPNTEANIYTYSGDIELAVSAEGKPYTALPAALKFRTTYDAACACKPPNQSWVQALADAEKLLEQRRTDILVTDQKSLELSRARPEAAARAKPRKPAADAGDAGAGEAAAPAADAQGAQTAGAANPAQQGELREITGPDGVKRRIRTIAPQL